MSKKARMSNEPADFPEKTDTYLFHQPPPEQSECKVFSQVPAPAEINCTVFDSNTSSYNSHDYSICPDKESDNNVFNETLQRVQTMNESRDFRCSYGTVCIEIFSNGRHNLPADPKDDPLTAVCLSYFHSDEDIEDETWVLYTRDETPARFEADTRYIYVKSENDLYARFCAIFQSFDPDVVVGWEIKRRSLGFLLKRAKYGIGWKKFGLNLSRTFGVHPKKYFEKNYEKDKYGIGGRSVLEYWRLAADELSLRSTSFEAAVYEVLGERLPTMKRIKLRTLWNSSRYPKVLAHLKSRTEKLASMIRKIGLLEIGYEVAGIANVSLKDALTRGCQVRHEGIFGNCCAYLDMVMDSPTEADVRESRAGEQIALNLEPESGLYKRGVAVLDFTSLYPTVIIAQNMCYTTIVGNYKDHQEGEPQMVGTKKEWALQHWEMPEEKEIHYTSTNCAFVNKEKRTGIMPQVQTQLLAKRQAIKKLMKTGVHSARAMKMLDSRQHALKMIANTMYGYTDAGFSGRMPNRHLAEAIVGDARGLTERAAIACKEMFGKKVVYGDTDSVFVDLNENVTRKNIGALIEYSKNMAAEITAMFPPPIDLKFEKVYWPCILETKKRYCGYPWEDASKKPELESKGIENIRRDGVQAGGKLVSKAATTLFDMVLDDNICFSKLKRILIKEMEKLKSNPVAFLPDLIFEKSWRGIDGYGPGSKIPAWKIAKIKFKRGGEMDTPMNGERIKYCVAMQKIASKAKERSVFSRTWEVEQFLFGDFEPDVDWVVNRHILAGLERLLGAVHPSLRASRWEHEIKGKKLTMSSKNISKVWKNFTSITCIACKFHKTDPGNIFCDRCKRSPEVLHRAAIEKQGLEGEILKFQKECLDCHQNVYGCASIEDLHEDFCTNLECTNNYRLVYTTRNAARILTSRLRDIFKK